jgi:acylphosphatase
MRFIVTGRVQGVFYRSHTEKRALELLLTGWVKNLPTGEVELLACGEREQVEALHCWLQKGPRFATVSQVSSQETPWEEHSDFVVLY